MLFVATDESSLLRIRRDQYKKAALIAKRSGNKELAIQHLRTVKVSFYIKFILKYSHY